VEERRPCRHGTSRRGLSQPMSDDKSKTVAERRRINIHEDYELRFWSKKFGVSPNELRCAVSKVGVFADDVARELGIRRPWWFPIGF
jgi:hypothetical protein